MNASKLLCGGVVAGLLWAVLGVWAADSPPFESSETAPTYGPVTVSRVLTIERDCTLICDIDAFPPIIGKRIPVQINGVYTPAASVDEKVAAFLEDLLGGGEGGEPPTIVLENIQRGRTFCLVADITVNKRDLADILVEKGLARRIIQLQTGDDNSPAIAPDSEPASAQAVEEEEGVVASRTSRVFHRLSCPHAKRIDPTRILTFQNRQEAEQNGRRPCKTCNP